MNGPIAVTGARGRLGSAMVGQLKAAGENFVAWSRPRYDLDDPSSAARLVEQDRPRLIVHTAAWVDVDGCAREPDLARRRNAVAAGELAESAARAGADLVLLSTNEVFDGLRADRHGYAETDPPNPANPYGATKLAAEDLAREHYAGASGRLWILRTSWLYGAAGNDFPAKILAALRRGAPLRVVDDEWGCPTRSDDLARAILALSGVPPDLYHVAGRDVLSRHAWAADLMARLQPGTSVEAIDSSEFTRASTPPPWGVLDSSRAAKAGIRVRGWREAAGSYVAPDAA